MGRPKRNIQATAEETATPPESLQPTQSIARVLRAAGNNLYYCCLPGGKEILAELPSRFRNTIWIKRGGYVLVDTKDSEMRENKLDGDIINVVRDDKFWRKQPYWPQEFVKPTAYNDGSEEEDSVVGKMPPSEGSDIED